MATLLFNSALFSTRKTGISCNCALQKSVVVTRERGKNAKLINALGSLGIHCLELPLIQHTPGPDQDKLPLVLKEKQFHWIVVTSPEAAAVFIDGWRDAGFPRVRVAVVGKGTRETFDSISQSHETLELGFVPSQANAKVLARELPIETKDDMRVLYPASLKASDDLATGLKERGFEVCRLNTYSTEPVQTLEESQVAAALNAQVVTFASPTAVNGWVKLVDDFGDWKGAAACIGRTSAIAAKNAGLHRVFYPENPGLEGWVDSIVEAMKICP